MPFSQLIRVKTKTSYVSIIHVFPVSDGLLVISLNSNPGPKHQLLMIFPMVQIDHCDYCGSSFKIVNRNTSDWLTFSGIMLHVHELTMHQFMGIIEMIKELYADESIIFLNL